MKPTSNPSIQWTLFLPAIVLFVMGIWMGILRGGIAYWLLFAGSLPAGLWLSSRRYPTREAYEKRAAPRSGQRIFFFDWMILLVIYLVIAWLDRQLLFPNGRLLVDSIYGAVFGYYLGVFTWPMWMYLKERNINLN
jgi:hypothetical protein